MSTCLSKIMNPTSTSSRKHNNLTDKHRKNNSNLKNSSNITKVKSKVLVKSKVKVLSSQINTINNSSNRDRIISNRNMSNNIIQSHNSNSNRRKDLSYNHSCNHKL